MEPPDPEPCINPAPIPEPLERFTHLHRADPSQIIDAQSSTTDFLMSIGAPDESDLCTDSQREEARKAFVSYATPATPEEQRKHLLALKTPEAVRHLVTMLSAYDWEFVNQAKELRGYAVACILEETQGKNPTHRLRALEMLGKVTEVALFTDRVKIESVDMTDEALEAKLKEKLAKFRSVIDVTNVIEHPPETITPEPTPPDAPTADDAGQFDDA